MFYQHCSSKSLPGTSAHARTKTNTLEPWQLYAHGELVGGLDVCKDLAESGEVCKVRPDVVRAHVRTNLSVCACAPWRVRQMDPPKWWGTMMELTNL